MKVENDNWNSIDFAAFPIYFLKPNIPTLWLYIIAHNVGILVKIYQHYERTTTF